MALERRVSWLLEPQGIAIADGNLRTLLLMAYCQGAYDATQAATAQGWMTIPES